MHDEANDSLCVSFIYVYLLCVLRFNWYSINILNVFFRNENIAQKFIHLCNSIQKDKLLNHIDQGAQPHGL